MILCIIEQIVLISVTRVVWYTRGFGDSDYRTIRAHDTPFEMTAPPPPCYVREWLIGRQMYTTFRVAEVVYSEKHHAADIVSVWFITTRQEEYLCTWTAVKGGNHKEVCSSFPWKLIFIRIIIRLNLLFIWAGANFDRPLARKEIGIRLWAKTF